MAGFAATLQPILRGDIGMMMMIYYVQWENACLQLCLIIESEVRAELGKTMCR